MTGAYPIDVSSLHKGSTLTREELEGITGHKAGSQDFRYGVMGLQKFIHEKSKLTVRINGDSLVILTDSQASFYNHHRVKRHFAGAGRRVIKMRNVDVGQLTPQELQVHDRNFMADSRAVSAAQGSYREIRIEGHKRSTPIRIEENTQPG